MRSGGGRKCVTSPRGGTPPHHKHPAPQLWPVLDAGAVQRTCLRPILQKGPMTNSRSAAGEADSSLPPKAQEIRLCLVCDQPIPEKRLRAAALGMCRVEKCADCTAAAGDVPRLRRHDETDADGLTTSVYFKRPTPYVADALRRVCGRGLALAPSEPTEQVAIPRVIEAL